MDVASYARRSPRPTESEQIARQLADNRALADQLGWTIVEEYLDKDRSAYLGKGKRESYERMLADVEAGRVQGIVAQSVTRLYRRVEDLVDFVALVQRRKVEVRTVTAGHYDLTTAAGRKHAYQAGLDAQYESDLLGERVARERRARAFDGRPTPGGVRPFGYEPDKVTVRESEARLVRAAAVDVAGGARSLYEVASDWNGDGVTTSAGRPWEVTAVRRVLTSPRIAGLRSFRGEVVGPAAWPALIDQDLHDRLRAMTAARTRGRPSRGVWLLSGLIACPRCGRVLYGGSTGRADQYRCSSNPASGRGCGGAAISATAADRKVVEVVGGWLNDLPPGLEQWMGGDLSDDGPERERAAIAEKRVGLSKRWAEGAMSDDEFDAAMAVLAKRTAELEAQPVQRRESASIAEVRRAWARGEVAGRRPVIEALVACPMPLAAGRTADPADRLTVRGAWEV